MSTPIPGEISLVEAQRTVRKHLGARVNVFVEGKFSFAVGLDVAGKHGLRPGLLLDDAAIEELLREDGESKAMTSALTFLGHRARSEAEIRARLNKDEWSEAVTTRVLERLRELKLVNDEEFALQWVDNRSRFKPRGGRMLGQELRQKGVERETIEAVLPDADEEVENALLALQKTARKWERFSEPRERQQKAIEFLARRGFGFGTAKTAWTRFLEETESDD